MPDPTPADRETAQRVLSRTHGSSWDDDVADNIADALATQRSELLARPEDHLQAVLRTLLTETDAYVSLEETVLVVDGRVDLDPDEMAAVRQLLTGSPLPAVEYSLTQTCEACPTQYDVELEDGRYAYFRYRSGHCSLSLYDHETSFWSGEPLAKWEDQLGDGLDGVMEHEQVVALVAEHLPRLVQEAGA